MKHTSDIELFSKRSPQSVEEFKSIGKHIKGIDASSELTNWFTSDIDNDKDGVKERPAAAAAASIMQRPTMMHREAIGDDDHIFHKFNNTRIRSNMSINSDFRR